MGNIEIRRIKSEEVEKALELALEVFMEFEAPDYGPEGIETFKKDIVENEDYIKSAKILELPIYAAFDGEKMVGIIGMRSSKTHINLVFTKKEYHRKGIATKIFRYLLEDVLKENSDLKEITLNSSPYGLPFYKHIGFVALSDEQIMNGIRYTPMKYEIKRKEYILKNGKSVRIREVKVEDAAGIVELIKKADKETLFLARNPGEFDVSKEKEEEILKHIISDEDMTWFVAEYEGKIVGQSAITLVRRYERYRHRAGVSFVILQDYCGMGIGGKLMTECINWCRERSVTQMELDVVTSNDRAINMYKGFGFEIVGTMPKALRYKNGSYADEYIMVCDLN